MTDEFAQSACVDRADLFDKRSGCLAEQVDLWAERAAWALADVGATSTTDRGSNSFA